jgi:tetratricopeptide (TPR) repeat protein
MAVEKKSTNGAQLTSDQLQAVARALALGAYESVRVVLESRSLRELDETPGARLLLARSLFDAGDIAAAINLLDRVADSNAEAPLAHHWRARVFAADGRADAAIAAVERLRACNPPRELVAATTIWVALTLGQCAQAGSVASAEVADRDGSANDDSALAGRLARNVAAIAAVQPEVAPTVGRSRPWDRFAFVDLDGTWTPLRRTGRDPEPVFEPKSQHSREADALSHCEPQLTMTEPVLIVGLGTGNLINELARITPKVGKRLAMLVVAPNWLELAGLLMIHDWSALIQSRVIWFLGPDPAELDRYLRADLRRMPRSGQFSAAITTDSRFAGYVDEANRVLGQIASDVNADAAALDEFYASESFIDRWKNRGPADPMRIMIQTCRYTTFIYNNSRQLADALCGQGHEIVLLEEGDEHHHWVGPLYVRSEISRFRPDLFIRTNFLRQEDSAHTPSAMPFLTWVMDYCPAHLGASRPERLLPHDYLTGFTKLALCERGYPAIRYLTSAVPSFASVYFAPACGPREYRWDVSFVSHHSTPVEKWIDRFRSVGHKPEVTRFVEALYEELGQKYRAGEVICHLDAQLGTAFADRLAPHPRPAWIHDYFVQLCNLFFRQTVLGWIAESGHSLAIFGNGWNEHPTLARHARGPVAAGTALREVYRSSRINLQLMVTGNFHQRVIDGLLAGGFFLMPRHPYYRPALPILDAELHGRLCRVLAESHVTTLSELEDLDHGLGAYVARLARSAEWLPTIPGTSDAERAFLQAESERVAFLERLFPSLAQVMFNDRAELLAQLARWLPADADREALVAAIQQSPMLRSLTTEFLVRRLLGWLSRRVGRFDAVDRISSDRAD